MSVTDPAAAQPSFLEKLGAEAIDVIIPLAEQEETFVLAFVDGEIAAGGTDLAKMITAAFSKKIPLVGATIGAEIATELTGLEAAADGAVKTGYDKVIALLQAKAKSWGG